jgi:hypothetical protein
MALNLIKKIFTGNIISGYEIWGFRFEMYPNWIPIWNYW